MDPNAEPSPSSNGIAQPESLRRWAFIIGTGIFATTLSQPDLMDLPLRNILQRDVVISPQEMAAFFALGAVPWYFKILAGLLSDCIPLFGTRRRHYLILSAILAGTLWVLLGYLPRSYLPLLLGIFAINVMLVFGSTVVGALLVEAGQRLDAAGRLVTVRIFVSSACDLVGGPLAGALAGLSFELAAVVEGAIALILAPVVLLWLNEKATAKYNASALTDAYDELRALGGSRVVWAVALFLILVNIWRAFDTPLFYHQTMEVQIPIEVIGYLRGESAIFGLMATVLYGFLCQRLPLRLLVAGGIVCGAAGTLAYAFYTSVQAAIIVHSMYGFLATLTTLALMELAVWATPARAAAMGFAIFMGAWNIAQAIGDNLGAALINQWSISFYHLAEIYAAMTALMVFGLLLLPPDLFTHRKG
jgi:hypothetical protein